jgi:outer membrane biosynthesis protein TonB
MTMRALPRLLALALGAGAALLVACGGASTKGGIPAASAGELKSQIEDVQQAVDGGRCNEIDGQLRQVDDTVNALPATVDERLRRSLRDAGDRLRRAAISECGDTTTTPTTTTPPQTQTEPQTQTQTPTATQPPPTTTTPPQTTTQPPPTTTPQPPQPPVPPPAEPPAPQPPPATTGGGTPGGGAPAPGQP